MGHRYKDEDTSIIHIRPDLSDSTLCGLMRGWTQRDAEPVKDMFGSTCASCQEEMQELRSRNWRKHG